MFTKVLAQCTPERASALLVCCVGSIIGAYAALGLKQGETFAFTPVQWVAAVVAVGGAIVVAVLVHTRAVKANVPAR
jgi:uncharacterized membrane protein YeaQ/YmgE (transglycosylase-associated protein family)